jgi:hypothetical protein
MSGQWSARAGVWRCGKAAGRNEICQQLKRINQPWPWPIEICVAVHNMHPATAHRVDRPEIIALCEGWNL